MTNELQKIAKCYKTCLKRLKTATRKCKITLKKTKQGPKNPENISTMGKVSQEKSKSLCLFSEFSKSSVDRMLPISTRLFAVLI